MKKYLITFAIAAALIAAFASKNLKNEQINDLLLLNIECLATPEDSNIWCTGVGSLDCPVEKIKVKFIWL